MLGLYLTLALLNIFLEAVVSKQTTFYLIFLETPILWCHIHVVWRAIANLVRVDLCLLVCRNVAACLLLLFCQVGILDLCLRGILRKWIDVLIIIIWLLQVLDHLGLGHPLLPPLLLKFNLLLLNGPLLVLDQKWSDHRRLALQFPHLLHVLLFILELFLEVFSETLELLAFHVDRLQKLLACKQPADFFLSAFIVLEDWD